MKRIAIFGATGLTGKHLVAQALAKGHFVRALVRNTNKLKECLAVEQVQEDHPNLEIWEVKDMFDENSLTLPLKDVDVVISTLGFNRGSTGYFDVTNNIVNTLKSIESGCRRCIFLHSWHSEPTSRRHCPFFLRWSLLLHIGPILDNMRKAEKILENTDDINYTFVLTAGLGKGPVTDCGFVYEEGSWFIKGLRGYINHINRSDVARYMLKTFEEDMHSKKIVAITPKTGFSLGF